MSCLSKTAMLKMGSKSCSEIMVLNGCAPKFQNSVSDAKIEGRYMEY
jgi:hypothetical protein